jgi:gas vesicle protein
MADNNSSSEFGAFFAGILIGGLVGAATALLLAPQSGEETRKQLSKSVGDIRDTAQDSLEDARERAEATIADARRRAERIVEEARERAENIAKEAKDARTRVEKEANGKPAESSGDA